MADITIDKLKTSSSFFQIELFNSKTVLSSEIVGQYPRLVLIIDLGLVNKLTIHFTVKWDFKSSPQYWPRFDTNAFSYWYESYSMSKIKKWIRNLLLTLLATYGQKCQKITFHCIYCAILCLKMPKTVQVCLVVSLYLELALRIRSVIICV